MKTKIIALVLFGIAVSCKQEPKTVSDETSKQFSELLSNFNEESYELNPLKATRAGDYRFNDQLPNFLSDAYKTKLKAHYTEYKNKLATIDESQLSETERMSKAVLEWECNINLEELDFQKDLMPIAQKSSLHLNFNQLAGGTNAQPFNSVEDYRNWLKRIDGYLVWLASAKENMKKGMVSGYVLPKSLILKVIPQFEGLATGKVEDHLYYTPVFSISEAFTKEEREELISAYTNMVANKIMPAYKDMSDFLKNEYLPAGRESSGISATPLGEDYYKHQIKKYTTTDMSADDIHQLGLSEVARIQSEMEVVKKEVGFEGDLKSFFDFVRTNKDLMPFTERSQVIAFYDSIYEVMKPQISKLFKYIPKTPFEVRRTETFREKTAAANYIPGSLDGTRPGIFYTPIPDVLAYNVFNKERLFLHEAIPGHHFQISLAQESEVLPEFRKVLLYSAYTEGWGLYTESMGKELGLYKDPYQYFGMLSGEIHRAIRLVVDTGLHAKGWTREQAIQYSLDNEAEPEDGIISEVERYMANPGQALSYKIGQLKIMEFRSRAQKKLGDKFDIREFHNQILETGCIPLQLLERKIDNWISETK